MYLIPKDIAVKIPNIYETDYPLKDDVVFHVKLFSCVLGWTWYISEYDPLNKIAYGYVEGSFNEWGLFSLSEFENINNRNGWSIIERDKYFEPIEYKDLDKRPE